MRRIANFLVEDEPLARGGMGQIFKGKDDVGNIIAVKEILPEFANDWSIISRIEKEVEFLVKVDHPSIVKLNAAFRDPSTDCYYIVMEFVEGVNIEQYVNRNGAMPPDKAVDIMVKILDAIQCVHNAHIIHRDIKPSNIMIRENGTVCLLDFGVAKDVDNKSSGTIVGSVIGTNGYMSPEQADGFAIDYRTDIYSLGCVFYFMLTGHHAFSSLSSEFETKDAILSNEFPRLSKYKKDLPNDLQRVLDKATAKNMTNRYGSCYEFMSDLRNGTHVSHAGHGSIPLKVTIGREMCDIIMVDSERKISRHHADVELVEHTGGKYYVLTDCSSNGTIVSNKLLSRRSVNIKADGPYPEVFLAGSVDGKLDWNQVIEEIDKKRDSVKIEESEIKNPEDLSPNNFSGDEKGEFDDLPDSLDESATGWLVAAFIFAFLGGLLGLIIGIHVAFAKQKQYNGKKIYQYKKSHRQLGIMASVISVISFFVWRFAIL